MISSVRLILYQGNDFLIDAVSGSEYDYFTWIAWQMCPFNEDVAVFRFYCPDWLANPPVWQAMLQPDEIQRAQRYRRQEDRFRSLYARSLLRVLLGKYLNQPALAVHLTRGMNNKPKLVDDSGWYFNTAHSGNWIVLAIGKTEIGVDVEAIKADFPFEDVLPFSFNAQERLTIEQAEQGRLRFYELWIRKEALVKATGQGIGPDFTDIASRLGAVWETTYRMDAGDAWTVGGFTVDKGYPGAVAYKPLAATPRFYTLDSGLLAPQ
ncbi:MAG: hypothetical protein JWP57_2336 [Spirosoma sp.]|nr:hypothetical protein [Spirosoma sp.]